MAAPFWAPALVDVADYVTSRTIPVDPPGVDTPLGTFTAATYPTDTQVGRLIEAACAWVTTVTGVIDPSLEDAALSAAAMRAAALVEMSYPERDADITEASQWQLQALHARTELVAANRAAGVEPVTGQATAPRFSFPPADPWCGNRPTM